MYRRLRTVCKHVIRDETLDVLIDDLYAMRDRGWLPTWTRVPSEPATGAHSASESFSSSSSFPWIVEQEEAERQWAARLARSAPDSTDQYRTGAYFRKRPAPSVSRAPVRHWQLTPFANKSVIIVLGNEGGGRRRRRYLGHVFVWQDENLPATLDMIGIRTSLENLACRDYSQMAYRILAAVVAYATASVAGYRFLQVASPLPNMAALLARLAGRRSWHVSRAGAPCRATRSPRTRAFCHRIRCLNCARSPPNSTPCWAARAQPHQRRHRRARISPMRC
jgi:hypothetical protein